VSRIVELAIAVADSEGLDAISMQRVASELGYTAMALYRHIPGKPELVDLMREAAFGLPPSPLPRTATGGRRSRAGCTVISASGTSAYLARIWQYDIASDKMTGVAHHDPARFAPPTPAAFNQDEESSGVIDVSAILGSGWYLLDLQAHYPNGTEAGRRRSTAGNAHSTRLHANLGRRHVEHHDVLGMVGEPGIKIPCVDRIGPALDHGSDLGFVSHQFARSADRHYRPRTWPILIDSTRSCTHQIELLQS
jgi:Bacterial regulatory proteins, tetR family